MTHPWSDYLTARKNCIHWMYGEGKNDIQILNEMNFDSVEHVTRIRERTFPPTPEARDE